MGERVAAEEMLKMVAESRENVARWGERGRRLYVTQLLRELLEAVETLAGVLKEVCEDRDGLRRRVEELKSVGVGECGCGRGGEEEDVTRDA